MTFLTVLIARSHFYSFSVHICNELCIHYLFNIYLSVSPFLNQFTDLLFSKTFDSKYLWKRNCKSESQAPEGKHNSKQFAERLLPFLACLRLPYRQNRKTETSAISGRSTITVQTKQIETSAISGMSTITVQTKQINRDFCHFWQVYDYRTDKTVKQRLLPFLAGLRLPYRQTDRQRQPPFLACLRLPYRQNR